MYEGGCDRHLRAPTALLHNYNNKMTGLNRASLLRINKTIGRYVAQGAAGLVWKL